MTVNKRFPQSPASLILEISSVRGLYKSKKLADQKYMRSRIDTLSIIRVLKNNREKENNLVATSRAELGIARHFLVGQAGGLEEDRGNEHETGHYRSPPSKDGWECRAGPRKAMTLLRQPGQLNKPR